MIEAMFLRLMIATNDFAAFLRALRAAWNENPNGGRMLITLPLGYNPSVDLMALGGLSGADHAEIFVRDRRHRWKPTQRPEPHQLRYQFELRSATALWIAEFGPL